MAHPFRRSPLFLLPLPALLVLVLVPASAHAVKAKPTGSARLALGAKGDGLRVDGLRLRGLHPAKLRNGRLVLPVSKIGVPNDSTATLRLRGGVKLVAGRRSARLTGFRMLITSRRVLVTAWVGRTEVTLFTAKAASKAKLDSAGGSASVESARLRLTVSGARALRKRLKLERLKAGPLGRLEARGRVGSSAGGVGPGGGGQGPGTAGDVPSCVPGNGAAVAPPVGDEPPLLARPTTAIAVNCAAISWRPRESFVQYVNSGEGTSVSGGAISAPKEVRPGSDAELVYLFHFPFKSGWYDPASGKAALYYQGRVRFRYSGHGIDLGAADPEVEIAGEHSRAIFRFDGSDGTPHPSERGVLVDLAPGTPVVTGSGKTRTYADMPGTIPEGTGESVFSGFYAPGDSFGSVGVSLTTP
jgi:hypothetical protein